MLPRMHLDPMMINITVALCVVLVLAYVTVLADQPIVVAYIISGVVLGPSGLALFDDQTMVARFGEIGVVMLLFFVGMEVSIPRLMARWKIALLGTAIQIAVSVAACSALTWLFDLPLALGVLFGFVISLSSTAVILKALQDSGEMDTPFGQNAVGVLLVQDMAIVPMMILLSLLGDQGAEESHLLRTLLGGLLVFALVFYLMRSERLHIPAIFLRSHEKRVLFGLLLCLGAATLTSWLGLSLGLGAFLAGMVLASSDQSEWVHAHLESLYVVFVMIFFLSVGMMVDLHYLQSHLLLVIGATMLVFIFNAGVNVLVMRALGESWEMALITGGLLSQIGEFSFLLAEVGAVAGILSDQLHELTVIVIAMTLLFSPLWVTMCRRLARREGLFPLL